MADPRDFALAHLTLMRPPEEMIGIAAAAGFKSVGVRICPRRPGEDYFVNLIGDTREATRLRRLAEDLGVGLSSVSAYQICPEIEPDTVLAAVEITAALGCRCIVVNSFEPDIARFEELLSVYAAAASVHGIRLALEFTPYSTVPTLQSALESMARIGADNLGLLIDALHVQRSNGTVGQLALLDPDAVALAQICDAPLRSPSSAPDRLMWEARHARLPLGEGELDLLAFLAALPKGIEIEYEVAGLPGATPLDAAMSARRNLRAFGDTLAFAPDCER